MGLSLGLGVLGAHLFERDLVVRPGERLLLLSGLCLDHRCGHLVVVRLPGVRVRRWLVPRRQGHARISWSGSAGVSMVSTTVSSDGATRSPRVVCGSRTRWTRPTCTKSPITMP